jgi:hypothetical protein
MEFEHDTTAGGSLQGYIFDITRAEIEKVFGKPTFDEAVEPFSGDGKLTVEWCIRFADGTDATIYDWKRYELGTPAMDERTDWNIGGNKFRGVELVAKLLGVTPHTSHDILVRAGLV